MGNAIKISIELDYEKVGQQASAGTVWAAQAGEPLTGKVIIKVSRKVTGDQVMVSASGTEKVYCEHNKRTVTNERSLYKALSTLADMRNRSVRGGTYSFPFRYDLPSSLPSTMSWGNQRNGCTIHYKISAGMGKFTTERIFQVASANMRNTQVPCFLEPKTETIKSLGVLNAGSVTFGASVDDTQIGRGHQIHVAAACINHSAFDIRSVEIKLVELITYSARNTDNERKRTLVEMKNIELPGLSTGRALQQSILKSLRASETPSTPDRAQIFEALASGNNVIRISIPQETRDSYVGSIIKIKHYLKIKMITPLLVDTLSVKIPLFIGNKIAQAPRPSPLQRLPSRQISRRESRRESRVRPPPPPPPQSPSMPPAQSDGEIPLVNATLVADESQDLFEESSVVQAHAVVLGGTPVERERDTPVIDISDNSDDGAIDIGDSTVDFSNFVPLAAPPLSEPSLSRLLAEMVSSVNDYDLISEKMTLTDWNHVFQSLQPADFGSVIAHINNDVDQPRVAGLVAERIQPFTCAHCVSALHNTSQWNRTTVVAKLVPKCVDLENHKRLISSELSEWEKTVLSRDLGDLLTS